VEIATRQEHRRVRLETPDLPLRELGSSGKVSLEISIDGNHARPARVDLDRRNDDWVVTRVRHG
jgi:hypothetical protein